MWTSWGGTILPTTRRETEKEPPAFPKGQGRSHTALSPGWAHGSVSGVGTQLCLRGGHTVSGSPTVCSYCHHGRAACASVVSLKLYLEDF